MFINNSSIPFLVFFSVDFIIGSRAVCMSLKKIYNSSQSVWPIRVARKKRLKVMQALTSQKQNKTKNHIC